MSKKIKRNEFLNKLIKKNDKYIYIILLAVAVLFVSLNSLSTIIYGYSGNVDSCIFNTIGKYWWKGYVPYISLFDHKGPIIFFLNMLSWSIFNSERGILFFQVMAVYVSLIFLWKTARLKLSNKKISLVLVILSLSYLVVTYFCGNMTEEFCLPFISACMYYNLKYIKNYVESKTAEHNLKYALLYGISFAVCFLTRLTNAVSICAGILAIMIILIREKKYKEIIKNGLCFITGFLILTIPFAVYFAFNDSFNQFLDATLLFNIKYATKTTGNNENIIIKIIKILVYFFPSYTMAILGIIKIKKNQKDVGMYYIILGIIETLLFMSQKIFRHYGIIMLPNCLLILLEIEISKLKSIFKKIIYVFVVLLGIACYIKVTAMHMENPLNEAAYDTVISMLNEEDKKSFIIWNGSVVAYEHYDIKPYYKYFVSQDWHASISDETKEDIHDTFFNGNVKWILFNGKLEDSMIQDVIDKKYEEYYKKDNMILYRIK